MIVLLIRGRFRPVNVATAVVSVRDVAQKQTGTLRSPHLLGDAAIDRVVAREGTYATVNIRRGRLRERSRDERSISAGARSVSNDAHIPSEFAKS